MFSDIYDFRYIEQKWIESFSRYTLSNDEIKRSKGKKYYVLEMLPYPSGKLHMGHVRNYTIGDVVSRYKKMLGFAVIHPMGWDSFGMPAENAAIKDGGHPKLWTNSNIQNMKEQLKPLGYMYDWEREISTCSEDYYSKEQKIFLDLYKAGLAYRKKSYVNWDPVEQTVLANEQVINGKGWRSGAEVEKKMLDQWSLKITDYAEELLSGIEDLKGNWPEKVLKMQENWIGKSEGALINFEIYEDLRKLSVFTTRPDTIFGASFLALSPDHEISRELATLSKEVADFIFCCKKGATTEEALEKNEKNGIFTGLHAKHPVIKGGKIPIYIANFVLIDYGTGAVFGCPAHDERDFDFAKKYDLPIIPVIESKEDLPYIGDGGHINSEYLNGMNIEEAKSYMITQFEELGIGQRRTTYRLRDWLISRQRYWGCPIPIIHCKKCGIVPADLPVLLPDDVNFNGKGNPLANHPNWKYVKCPICGIEALRDTDTLDTFFESSWYFMRYLDSKCDDPINKEISDIAMPVDICIGGIEHAVLHLLYARFFMLALHDMGYLNSKIPFRSLLTQGMVCHKSYKDSDGNWVYPDEIVKTKDGKIIDRDGRNVFEFSFEKMSKSKKNTVSPQKIIDSHGADAVRMFMVSDTPPEKDFDWNTDALDGALRFLNKVWKVFGKIHDKMKNDASGDDSLIKTTHVYLKKIKTSYESISLNKAVALIRELFNEIESRLSSESATSLKFAFESFIKILYPVTPYICHEIWELFKKKELLQNETWPEIDEALASADFVNMAIQINGKLRGTFEIEKDSEDSVIKSKTLELILGKVLEEDIKKIIIVKNRVVNVVV
ncbi:MAG: leucine--tRNA ligase [Holosporales bacterium]|jgi:leucyl-tRNA synthetase|nr:leucine--tRNA ligase [Holosporales bacterium]